MKKLFKPFIAVVLVAGIYLSPVVAQTPSNETTTTRDIDTGDNSSKWGLVGLLGLLGLIPMKKTEKTSAYTTNPNR